MITSLLVMQFPVSEADAATSASDFQMDGSTLVRYRGTSEMVSIPRTVTYIEKGAFEDNTSIKTVVIPGTVTDIGAYAFWGCGGLETVRLGNGMTQISDYAFANCKGLKKVEIPSTVRSIGIQAFADCVNLTDITIPPEVNDIHETAFDGCVKLTIHATAGTAADKYIPGFLERQAEMPEYEDVEDYASGDIQEQGDVKDLASEDTQGQGDVENSASGAVREQDDLTEHADSLAHDGYQSEVLLGSTQVVGNRAVVFLDNIAAPVNEGNIPEEGVMAEGADTSAEDADILPEEDVSGGNAAGSGEKGGSLPKYTVVEGVQLADQAYYRDQELEQISLPEGIRSIGQFSFARSALTQITLPQGTEEVGYGAFYHCDNLQSVSLPDTIQSVEPKAFTYTAWVEQFLRGGTGDYLISGGVLVAYRGTGEKAQIPEGVRVIAAEAFAGHGELRSVSLPDSLVVIGEGAFENCENLSSIIGGTGVTDIKDRAFGGCPVDTIRIVDSVERIGLGAFDYSVLEKEDMTRAAVFHGSRIPAVSYETSAGRLSNEDYRVPVLHQVTFAVIEESVPKEALRDTVLSSSVAPFMGIICSIGQDNKLHCRYTNLTQEELSQLEIPDKAYLYGAYYEVADRDQIESLAEEKTLPESGAVQIAGTVSGVQAALDGARRGYVLRLQEPEPDLRAGLEQAYQRIYHTSLPEGCLIYDITLTEAETGVPITKLGKQPLTVSMPVPDGLSGQNIQVITQDRNGQLETVPAAVTETDSGNILEFVTSHFSCFGFYGKGTLFAEGRVQDGQVVIGSYGKMDDSPDTGDAVHPKWFLGIGLLFAAFALILSKDKKAVQ